MYDHLLVSTDGSDGVASAIDHAIDAAVRYDAVLHVLYVVDENVYGAYSGDEFVHESEGAERSLRETGHEAVKAVAEQAASADVETTTAVRYGTPYEEIVDYATDNDIGLVVVGNRHRSGEYRQLLGSTSERVAQLLTIPVTIVTEQAN